jgi:NAD(P)-dependent dehydrogenase (short-subunit alcohol dehydrogenase family)
MSYLVTGGTGFIGRQLVSELAKRGESIYIIVRASSLGKLESLRAQCEDHGQRIIGVSGDLREPLLGVTAEDRTRLRGRIRHFLHLGAVYDLTATDETLDMANVLGTDHALALADDLGAGCFHLVSSIASAGEYPGTFTEDMFDEAVGLDQPYFRTKHESEALVRRQNKVPWRVYRPSMVVGHSATGYIDKVDGPYYFFKMLQKLRRTVPPWMPLVGLEGGEMNMVPVDFVARAIDHLAHLPDLDEQCFHLTDPRRRHVGEVLNLFAKAAHAPTMTMRLDSELFAGVPQMIRAALASIRPLNRIVDEILRDLGMPKSIVELLNYPTTFDNTRTTKLLAAANIRVPPLEDYAWRLWDYWERHLDPDLSIDRSLAGRVNGKVVVITGGSSGIGKATAMRVAEAGAIVVIVARDEARLAAMRETITGAGGTIFTYSADLSEDKSCEAVARQILSDHGRVDVLINNAGKSIRRAIENSYDRFHDYERLMRINYFAAVRFTLSLLPSMVERHSGHVISISSIGVLANSPRFSAYVASKAALEGFTNCAAAEYSERGVRFSVVNMPLVRTPMTAPTRLYEKLPLITPEEAADIVCEAIIHQPKRLATKLGIFAQLMSFIAPKLTEIILSQAYRMFPESAAARGALPAPDSPESLPTKPEATTSENASEEMVVFASVLRGIHW